MGGERQERPSIWGAQRRVPGAKDERTSDEGVSPKAQHVLDLQRQAGNAAVTGVVQRSMWGDDWMEGIGNGLFVGQDNGASNQGGQPQTNWNEPGAGLGGAGGAAGNQGAGYKEMSGGGMGSDLGGQNGAPFGGGQEQSGGKEEASFPWGGGNDQNAWSKDTEQEWK
jgi:hypothetical protein